MNNLLRASAILLALGAYGCHNSSSNDDSESARPILAAFNAVADLPPTTFLREEEVWSSIDFGVSTNFRSVDADQYDLHFDVLLPGDDTTVCNGDIDSDGVKDENECTRVAERSINVIGD